MNWEHRAAAAVRSRSDAHVLRERADVVVRYLLRRKAADDPDLEEALVAAGVDADRARRRCREMLDTALFAQGARPRDILGVSARAPVDEVRSQYKRLVQLYHPDRDSEFDDDLSSDRLTRLRQALDAALDPQSAPDPQSRPAEPRSDSTGTRRQRRTTARRDPEQRASGHREFTDSASGYDQGASQASRLSTAGHTPSRSTKRSPSAKEKFFQRLGQQHRPESSQISFMLFALAGIAGVFYYLVNDPCAVKGDCDPVAANAVPNDGSSGVIGSSDALLAYPDIRTLLSTYSNAWKTRNMALLTQQFSPEIQENDLTGIGAVGERYERSFTANPGPRQFNVRTVHEKDDRVFSIEGTMIDHGTDSAGAITVFQAPFFMQVRAHGGKLRIVNFRYQAAPGSGS